MSKKAALNKKNLKLNEVPKTKFWGKPFQNGGKYYCILLPLSLVQSITDRNVFTKFEENRSSLKLLYMYQVFKNHRKCVLGTGIGAYFLAPSLDLTVMGIVSECFHFQV